MTNSFSFRTKKTCSCKFSDEYTIVCENGGCKLYSNGVLVTKDKNYARTLIESVKDSLEEEDYRRALELLGG
ncbi:hypothetical protein TMA_045 [Thermus phage TMA]|uniref:hypothetical protein n=1 Tax=Thermus phage TMA TaxID=699370 RepID=UPI00021AAE3E|nr:hypothetical protein TMA_045 [Thermus phage TMA]BAK53733.1 hypothetical protein TMA_045 [Thermus phage TMA]